MTTLTPPLSKSDAQRALVLADVVGTPLDIEGEALPRDVELLRDGLIALKSPTARIDCRDGGAPFRFLLGQAAVRSGLTIFTGSSRLAERPHEPLVAALKRALPIKVTAGNPWPLIIDSPGTTTPIHFEVDASLSSQFASSLLLAAARVAHTTQQPCSLTINSTLASEGYFALTQRWLERFGFHCERGIVTPGRITTPPKIPGDWSSLGYLLLLSWASRLPVARVQFGTSHPDEHVIDVLAEVGLTLDADEIVKGTPTRGIELDASLCPDAIPTLAVLATKLPEPSRFTNTSILRLKESDRVKGIIELLTAAGIRSELTDDTLVIIPSRATNDLVFDPHDDHRLAMSAAVLARLHDRRLSLRDPDCVAKSFPGFWGEARKAGIELV